MRKTVSITIPVFCVPWNIAFFRFPENPPHMSVKKLFATCVFVRCTCFHWAYFQFWILICDSSLFNRNLCNPYVFCIVLLKYTSSGVEHMLLQNIYIHFGIHSASQNMQAAHTLCTYAPPYHQRCCRLLNWTLMTRWKVSLLFSPEDTASVISNENDTFGLVWP